MKIQDIITSISIFALGCVFMAGTLYFTTINPQNKTIREHKTTSIVNEYNGKIKTRKGGEVLLDVNSAINDTIKAKTKWWKFEKK